MLLALLLAAVPTDAPRAIVLLPAATASTSVPASLLEARKLSEQLRYEEAVVEYQRYLGLTERPLVERAAALIELGFIHLVLGDAATAEARALEAFELDPQLKAPAGAQSKQVDFVKRVRKLYLARARVELVERQDSDPPSIVRVNIVDPEKVVTRVLLRHALTATGPYYATEMRCDGERCETLIPAPKDASSYTAWYFVEALDPTNATVAKVGGADAPLQLAVVNQRPWYASPLTWGIAGAALVGVATVIFLLAPPPPT